MFKKIQVSEQLNFYSNDDINVTMGDDETEVNLGVLVEIADTRDFDENADENYPYVVSMGLMVSQPHESFNESDNNPSQAGLLYDCNSYMGSVPVDHILVNGVNEGLKEILPMFNIGEAKLVTQKAQFGTVAAQHGKDHEFQYLMFNNEDAAQKFVDFIINNRASVLSMMVGFILDRPINLMGESGWSQVEKMNNGV